jgi:PPOX class probable F420-dependent enzyme
MLALEPATTGDEGLVAMRPPESTATLRSLVRLHELLANARVIWLSTTRSDGRPHVVPSWFDWDGEHITVFTRPQAQKVRNVRHEPRVMVAVGRADVRFEVELLEAEAEVVDCPTASSCAVRPSQRFATKYADALRDQGGSVETFAADYPSALRIRPTRLLDWGARELSGAASRGL